MNWKLKCLAFHLLGYMPGGARTHRWLKEHVTHTGLTTLTKEELELYSVHVDHYREAGCPARVLEIGAGANLIAPLLLSAAGAQQILACDLNRLATPASVNHVVRQLRQLGHPGEWPEIGRLEDLDPLYRIDYRAPFDVRVSSLPEGSVDFIFSTAAFEHIPPKALESILTECLRLASPSARLSFLIDYHDHYAGTDSRLTDINFYRYPDRIWRLFNPAWHYQNRLRHSDFTQLFGRLGFTVSEGHRSKLLDQNMLGQVELAPQFRSYEIHDLLTVEGKFLLTAP
jgi:SAM-dependent methyltransferase